MKNRKKLVSVLAGIMAAVMLLSLLLSLIPVASAASSGEIRSQINDLKDMQDQIKEQMAELEGQFQENESEILNLVKNKALLDQEIFLLHAQIGNINQQLTTFALLIADQQDELDDAQESFDKLSDEHRDRIRAMEEEGSLSYWAVLFKASSFSDLLDRLNMIEEIAASDRRRLDALNAAANLVIDAKEDLEAEKAELEQTRQELDDTYAKLEEKQEQAQEMLTQLLERADELEELYKQFAQEEADLLAEIARKEKEYNDAKYREWLEHMATATTATTAPPTTAPPETTQPKETTGNEDPTQPEVTDPGQDPTQPEETQPEATQPPTEPEPTKPASEGWIRPCSYVKLTSPFGTRESPTAGASTYHEGVDLAGPEGTPIYAARSGNVTIARYSNSAGYYVTLNHGDGFSSVYMHMTTYTVSVGQYVSQGQLIGYMGNTGISTGPHLHFGIALNGTYVNPALYVAL